jgi:hypothetical protein
MGHPFCVVTRPNWRRYIYRIDDAIDVGLVAVEQMAEIGIFWSCGMTLWVFGEALDSIDETYEPLCGGR